VLETEKYPIIFKKLYFSFIFFHIFSQNSGYIGLRHQANRKLSKWQLVAKGKLK